MSQSAKRFEIASNVPIGSIGGYELRAAAKLMGITSGHVVEGTGRATFPEPYVAKNRVQKFFRGAPNAPDLGKEVHSFLLGRADQLLNKLAVVLKFDIEPAGGSSSPSHIVNAALREALALRIAADQALLKALTDGGL